MVRFTPSTATFTEFDMPMKDSKPIDIVADSNGNIWITEAVSNQLVKIDVSKLGSLKRMRGFLLNLSPPRIYLNRALNNI